MRILPDGAVSQAFPVNPLVHSHAPETQSPLAPQSAAPVQTQSTDKFDIKLVN